VITDAQVLLEKHYKYEKILLLEAWKNNAEKITFFS